MIVLTISIGKMVAQTSIPAVPPAIVAVIGVILPELGVYIAAILSLVLNHTPAIASPAKESESWLFGKKVYFASTGLNGLAVSGRN